GRPLLAMGDLPAAGAVYLVHGAAPPEQQRAVELYKAAPRNDEMQALLQAGSLRLLSTLSPAGQAPLQVAVGAEARRNLKPRARRRAERLELRRQRKGQIPEELRPNKVLAVVLLVVLLLAAIGALVIFVFTRDAIRLHYSG